MHLFNNTVESEIRSNFYMLPMYLFQKDHESENLYF